MKRPTLKPIACSTDAILMHTEPLPGQTKHCEAKTNGTQLIKACQTVAPSYMDNLVIASIGDRARGRGRRHEYASGGKAQIMGVFHPESHVLVDIDCEQYLQQSCIVHGIEIGERFDTF